MTKKISEICTLIQGRNIDKKKLSDEGIPYITGASCIQKGVVVCNRFVDEATCKGIGIAVKGDLIVSCVGTLGKIGILQYDRAVVSKHVFALHPITEVDVLYLLAIVTSLIPLNSQSFKTFPFLRQQQCHILTVVLEEVFRQHSRA